MIYAIWCVVSFIIGIAIGHFIAAGTGGEEEEA